MDHTLHMGRIAGLPVDIHWSVLFIVWLLAWNLAAVVLPDAAPGHSAATYWLAGLTGAIVFFGSLLAHEIAHAVAARRSGVEVKGLTLWLLGGVASLGDQPPTPEADLAIAAAGPLTSLGLSLAFGVVAYFADLLRAPDVVVALVIWLAVINLVLAVFNLIPGAPLDGGRVLRALLWRRDGDWARAAMTATKAGQTVGHGLMWLGVLEVLLVGVGGLWLILVGWFVVNASRSEYAEVLARHVLRGVRVGQVMSRSVHAAPGWVSVQYLVDRYLLERPHSAYPVEDRDGRIVGLVTLRQLREVPAAARASTLVADVAVPLERVQTVSPGEPLVAAIEHSGDDAATGGRILVFEGGHLVGIVTPADVTRASDVRTVRTTGSPPTRRPTRSETRP